MCWHWTTRKVREWAEFDIHRYTDCHFGGSFNSNSCLTDMHNINSIGKIYNSINQNNKTQKVTLVLLPLVTLGWENQVGLFYSSGDHTKPLRKTHRVLYHAVTDVKRDDNTNTTIPQKYTLKSHAHLHAFLKTQRTSTMSKQNKNTQNKQVTHGHNSSPHMQT